CVPPDRLAAYVRGVRDALDRQGIRGVIFGHAGDAHVHVNPLVDVSEPDWRARVIALLDEVASLTARLGGTLSGEHGDGRLRAPLLPRVWPAESLARDVETGFRAGGAVEVLLALDEATERSMWELRHAASPILGRLDPSLKSMQFIEDGCVPPDRLAAYVRGVRGALDRQGIRGVIFGHAGDAHVHVNPLVDVSEPGWRARIIALLDEVASLTARLGGTLSGEHGDGRLRAPLLPRVWPAESLARFAVVKRAFDPDALLNPGAKLAVAGERPVDLVKYDPALPPLPAPARRALDTVERDRAYARLRLELLAEPAADGSLDSPPGVF
ncbi:MAG TPA: FAD-linked oxidase C-terminal domain-containing protein, partial [Conexibacter sp.]|nr:FAD-linked oxidase C-terminal domain-containing protein [Conexibacter sp.]